MVSSLRRFRYLAGLSAPVYLLALFLLRERIPGGIPFRLFTAIGPLVTAYFLAAYLLDRNRDDRVPDLLPLLVWGSAAAMEIHAFVPPVARTSVVPAALFFGLGLKCPRTLSIPAILCVSAWLAAVPGPIETEIYYLSAMALIAGGAGIAIRGKYRDSDREMDGVREAIARSRALVLPWEESGNRRYSRKRGDDRGIQPAPEGRGTEGWDPGGAGSPVGADRRFPCRLHRPLRIARIRSPRRGPPQPRVAGLPGDLRLPDTYVPASGSDRLQETVSRSRAGCKEVRPVGKRSGERPRRGRRGPGVQGGGGGRGPPCDTRRRGRVEGSRDPGDGTGGSLRGARYRADACAAPGGPVLPPGKVVPRYGPEDGGRGDG